MIRFSSAVVFGIFLVGCKLAPVERPYPPPTLESIADDLDARKAMLGTLRAEAKVDHMARGAERFKVRVTLLVARGGKIRLEVDSPLGGSLATLASDGTAFAMLDVRKNRFLVGEPSACNVGQLLGLELPPADVMAILTGGVPESESIRGGKLSWDRDHGGRERIDVSTSDGGRLTLFLRAKPGERDVVAAERLDKAGTVTWRVRHDAYEVHENIRLPSRTTVEQPARRSDAEIRYRVLEPNVKVPDGAFTISPPGGISPERVTCVSAQDFAR